MLSPDIRVQTESKKHKNAQSDTRKKSLIDSGIELLFKKHNRNVVRDGGILSHTSTQQIISHPLSNDFNKFSTETTLVPSNERESSSSSSHNANTTIDEHHKWKLFDTIKIHTDKRKSIDSTGEI